MSKNKIEVEFKNELNPNLIARVTEKIITINLNNNYTPLQQQQLLDKFVEYGYIKG